MTQTDTFDKKLKKIPMIKENEKRGIHPNAHTTINQADLILKASLASYY